MVQPLPRRRRLLLAEAVVVLQRMSGGLRLPEAAWRCGRPIGRPQRFLLQQQTLLVRDNEDACRLYSQGALSDETLVMPAVKGMRQVKVFRACGEHCSEPVFYCLQPCREQGPGLWHGQGQRSRAGWR